MPEIVQFQSPIAEEPAAQGYVAEFAELFPTPAVIAVADQPQPVLPMDRRRVKGCIFDAKLDQNSSLWTILSYDGENWTEDQHCYLLFEKSGELREAPAICSKGTISELNVLLQSEQVPTRLLCSFTYEHFNSEFDELWTCDLRGGDWVLISNGHSLEFSPDRSKATFWRSDDFAFHCLYVWNIQSGAIRPIVSLNEADPGSGTSWETRWSQDSKAISIRGDCTGFEDARGDYQEFDFIYLVASDMLVSCK